MGQRRGTPLLRCDLRSYKNDTQLYTMRTDQLACSKLPRMLKRRFGKSPAMGGTIIAYVHPAKWT